MTNKCLFSFGSITEYIINLKNALYLRLSLPVVVWRCFCL